MNISPKERAGICLNNFILQKDRSNFTEHCSMINEDLYEIINTDNGDKILRMKKPKQEKPRKPGKKKKSQLKKHIDRVSFPK